jgi:hypothetical protein
LGLGRLRMPHLAMLTAVTARPKLGLFRGMRLSLGK